MRSVVRAAALAVVVCFPSWVYAQASIAGVVRDASGGVLPGVTVEATSPALIEKVRSVVTDGTGQYRIIDLRPGTYAVTVRRSRASAASAARASSSPGRSPPPSRSRCGSAASQETITVTGESPIVDTQSVRRQTTLSSEVLTTVPTARSWAATAVLIPGIVTQAGASADVQVTPQMTVFGGMGGRGNEGRMQVDGLNTGAALNGGGVSTYVADISNAAEVVTTTSGGLGEAEVGGPTLSIVPRSGGNHVTGSIYLSGVTEGMVGSNYSRGAARAGLSTPGQLLKQWDFTGGVGGPIMRDRIWYYVTARDEGQHRSIPGIFPNLNAGDPTKWEYDAGHARRQARGAESFQMFSARFTVQATPRNKFNVHWDWQVPCNGASFTTTATAAAPSPTDAVVGSLGLGGLTATTSPETAGYLRTLVQNRQVTWSSPVDQPPAARGGPRIRTWPSGVRSSRPATRRATWFASPSRRRATAPSPACNYRSANWGEHHDNPNTWRGSASYVTGAHSMKVGYIGGYLVEDIENHGNDLNLAYTFNGGRPTQLTQSLRVFTQKDRVRYTALYVAGPVDDGQADAAGRAALRPRLELLAGAADRSDDLPAHAR